MAGNDRITLNFGANVEEVTRGADEMADALGGTEQKLDDVGAAGENAGRSAADGLEQAGQAGSDAEGVFGDVGDSLLGIAGIAGGVGGAVSTALGAAGDFVKDKIDEQIKAAEELRARLIAAYRDAATEGQTYLDQATIIAAAQDIIFDSAKRADATKDAAAIGVDVNTFIKAQAGDYEALKVVIEAAKEAEKKRREEGAGSGSKSEQAGALQEVQNLQKIITENEKLLAVHEDNQAAAQAAIDISTQLSEEQRNQIKKTADADQARYEGIAANVAALKGEEVDVPVTFSVDESAVESYIAELKRRRIPIVADVVDRYGRDIP